MDSPSAPPEIAVLAEERAAARADRDWASADELRARIEAAGWRVVDFGNDFELAPARVPDVVGAGQTLYGAVESVPSRLDTPELASATVVVLVTADGASPETTLSGLAANQPDDTQVVVVTDSGLVVGDLAGETIRTAVPFSPGQALQAALRRATGHVVVVLEPGQVPTGDIVTPLTDALADPAVAIAGIEGLRSADLHRYHPAENGDATTLRSGCYAFRRADAISRGPIDGRLHLPGSVAAWWGLTLRDAGPDEPPRRALVVDLPLAPPEAAPALPDDHARRARRDNYRITNRFRGHSWLTAAVPPDGRIVGDGAESDSHHDDPDEGSDSAPA